MGYATVGNDQEGSDARKLLGCDRRKGIGDDKIVKVLQSIRETGNTKILINIEGEPDVVQLHAVTGLEYDAVPPRTLPDQGIEALIDLIMLIESKCEWPNLCNRTIFIAKAAGGVRPIGLLFAIVRIQCKLRRIEAKMWEARNTEGIFWATQARDVERCVWEQAAWSEWATADGHAVATILSDLLKAFDHVAYH